jgi:hypothetical protein
MSIIATSFFSPFATSTYSLTLAPGPTYAMNGALVQGCTIGQQAMGQGALAALYTNFKVMSYRVTATFMPQNVADTSAMVLLPVGLEEIPSTSAAAVDLRVLSSQPRAQTRICETTTAARENTLSFAQDSWDLVGVRKPQWLDFPNAACTGYPQQPQIGYVAIYLQQLNGANNAALCTLRVTIDQVVEFTDLLNPIG